MKKLFALILSAAITFSSLPINTLAFGNSTTTFNSSMSIDEFAHVYSGESSLQNSHYLSEQNSSEMPAIQYSNISYDATSRRISFDAMLSINGETSTINAAGVLFSSYKADHGVNSIVGDISDTTNQYQILRFEIYNDTNPDYLLAINTPKTAAAPTLLMYLLRDGLLYLFETPIPAEMSSISIPNIASCKTDEGGIDGFWFQDILNPDSVSTDGNLDITPMAEDNRKIYRTVTATWVIAGVSYNYYARTQVYYRFVDVNTNDSTWELEFRIIDAYAYVDGVKSNLTGLRITNLDMSMASGPYTRMLRVISSYNLTDTVASGNPSSLSASVGLFLDASGNKAATLAADIFSFLLNSNLQNTKLPNNGTTLLRNDGKDCGRAFRYYVPKRYFLQYVGDNVHFQIVTSASNFGKEGGTNGSRTGIAEVSFDYHTGDGSTQYHYDFDQINGTYYCTLK